MKKTRIRPFGDRVLVVALTDYTSDVLAIPQDVRDREKPVMGRVIEIGDDFLPNKPKERVHPVSRQPLPPRRSQMDSGLVPQPHPDPKRPHGAIPYVVTDEAAKQLGDRPDVVIIDDLEPEEFEEFHPLAEKVKVGDTLIFPNYAGMKLGIRGHAAFVLRWQDIHGKIVQEDMTLEEEAMALEEAKKAAPPPAPGQVIELGKK